MISYRLQICYIYSTGSASCSLKRLRPSLYCIIVIKIGMKYLKINLVVWHNTAQLWIDRIKGISLLSALTSYLHTARDITSPYLETTKQ